MKCQGRRPAARPLTTKDRTAAVHTKVQGQPHRYAEAVQALVPAGVLRRREGSRGPRAATVQGARRANVRSSGRRGEG
eukprot:11186071-Lingulodinium_polyedra.AAC.1